MKRLLLGLLLLPQLVYSQYQSRIFELNQPSVNQPVGITVTKDTTIAVDLRSSILGLSVSGKVTFQNSSSFVRIVLKDNYNYEHLVYDNYPLLADDMAVAFSNKAMETIALDDVVPQSIRIEVHNAVLELESFSYSIASASNKYRNPAEILKSQSQSIVNQLNKNLEERNMTWRAGMTSMAEKSYEDKKAMFGGKVPQMYGFEYYAGGIFVIPEEDSNDSVRTTANNNRTNQYVSEWDWRNRHGKNWMTPVKDQGNCKSCWAFAATGVLESYINLYYNQLINYHLSELELISCTNRGCIGGFEDYAFDYILDNGIVEDDCFHYTDTLKPCILKCNDPVEKIYIDEYQNYTVSEAQMKELLFKAPMTIGFSSWGHSMVLAGYKKISNGDVIYWGNTYDIDSVVINEIMHQDLIGCTAWLIKSSWGETWGNLGYAYVLVDNNYIDTHCYINGNITSQVYFDSDIVCEDADGDGYYFWGIGSKPAHCPSWAPNDPDGDDSNINFGPLDYYGNLQQLSPNGVTVDTSIINSSNSTMTNRIGIVKNGVLTITGTVTMAGDAKIRVCENGTLIVDGGTIQNANLELVPGCHLIVRNNGTISMASGLSFDAPVGAIIDIDEGIIN